MYLGVTKNLFDWGENRKNKKWGKESMRQNGERCDWLGGGKGKEDGGAQYFSPMSTKTPSF